MPLILFCPECYHEREINFDLENQIRSKFNLEESDDLAEGIKINQNKVPCSKCDSRVVEVVELKKCRGCENKIPAGRIFALPNTEYCVGCVNATVNEDNYNEDDDNLGNCPRCKKKGIESPLVWRERRREDPHNEFIYYPFICWLQSVT